MIKVGIVGAHPDKGWAALAHVPALKELPAYALTAVSHHSLDVARAAAERFGVPHAFASTEELVAAVDLVVVAVNVTHHRAIVTSALDAGKAVLAEWPLGVDLADAVAMRDRARERGVLAAIGLQARAAPALVFVRDRLREGHIGRVLSSTLVGSGIFWGETLPEASAYTLDPANGASMVNVTFAHSIDAVLAALDGRFVDLTAKTASVRKTLRLLPSGREVPMTVPDQIAVAGVLDNGIFLSAHFRGGLSRATNFRWEVNGTEGDLVVTTPVGYTGAGGFRVEGARGDEGLHELVVPASYGGGFEGGLTQSIALAYRRLASDLATGTRLAPTFDDAVALHRLVDRVAR